MTPVLRHTPWLFRVLGASLLFLLFAFPVAADTFPLSAARGYTLSGRPGPRDDAWGATYELRVLDKNGTVVPNAEISIQDVRGVPSATEEGVWLFHEGELRAVEQTGRDPKLSVDIGDENIVTDGPLDRPGRARPEGGRLSGSGDTPGVGSGIVGGGGTSVGRGGREGLVTCGQGATPCNIRDLFALGARIFNYLLYLGGAVALLALIWAGLRYILAVLQGADSSAIAGAKQSIVYALIGLVVLLGAVVIVRTVLLVFGLGPGLSSMDLGIGEAGRLIPFFGR